ncbi:GLUG motif-containing protein [Jutongia sp.]
MNAKAETAFAENVPESLAIYSNESSTWQIIDIIKNGVLQDDGVANNEATEYKETNWYYDGAKNKLVLENASIENISVENGDLTILSSGENTLSGYIHSKSSNGEHTLELKGDNSGCLTVGKSIQDLSNTGQQMNLKITDATVKAQEITCKGSMRIENSRVIVSAGDDTYYAMKADSDINITNSYVEVKQNRDQYAISTTNNGIVVSNSQIMACSSGGYEDQVIDGGSFSDAVVTIGGICGYNGGTITNCYNTGTVTATGSVASVGGVCGCSIAPISNCYNIGTVTATSSSTDISGICGYNFGPVTNCYYLADTEDENGSKTVAQFASGEIAYLLSQGCSTGEGDNTVTYDGSIWGQTIGTDTYPTLGGAKVYKNAIYEGCEGKPGEPVSYEYSNTEKNTYGDHPDADNDGKCDDCDQYIDGIGAKLAGYSLSLTGNIGVNFYMELSDKIIADKDAYMQFTLPNGTVTKVLVSEAQTNTTIKEGTTYYRFPCEVASYEMTQDIKAQMFDGNGNGGKEYTYTVRDYAQYLINHVDLYQEVYPFAITMLNYGACSQKYFNKAVDELANKYLNDDEQEIPDRFDGYIDNFVAKKAENDALGQFAGLSMVLKSETTLNLFYEPKEGVDVSKLTFLVDGKGITPVKRGQYYILSLENIKENELGNSKTFTVTDGTNTLSGEYCAMMYCYQVLQAAEGTYVDDLVTLVKAFSDYAYTAKSVCRSN